MCMYISSFRSWEPSADDYRTGTRAGARGGVTTLIDFAIPTRRLLNDAADKCMSRAQGKAMIDYTFHICTPVTTSTRTRSREWWTAGHHVQWFMIYESEGRSPISRTLRHSGKMKSTGHAPGAASHPVCWMSSSSVITLRIDEAVRSPPHRMTRPNFISGGDPESLTWSEATGGSFISCHVHR